MATVFALGLGVPAAHGAPLDQEVTGEWACELQAHRPTDFRIGDGDAAVFTIPRHDAAIGEFRRIEVTQSIELITNMTVSLDSAAELELIRVGATHVLWTNVPPSPVVPNTPPGPGDRDGQVFFAIEVLWADGIYPRGFTDLGTRTFSDDASFSSVDSGTWVGSGSVPVTLQTLTFGSLTGAGGNGTYLQQTTAQAELCYRYTFVPAADEPPADEPPANEPPVDEQPADEPASEPEAGVDPEPQPQPELQRLPDLGPEARTATLTTWALFAASVIVGGVLLRQRERSRLPRATLVSPD